MGFEGKLDDYIEVDPYKPGPGDVRLKDSGVPVWALIGYLPAVGEMPEWVARDYDLPIEAVEAAIAYYEQNRGAIDARLAANRAPVA